MEGIAVAEARYFCSIQNGHRRLHRWTFGPVQVTCWVAFLRETLELSFETKDPAVLQYLCVAASSAGLDTWAEITQWGLTVCLARKSRTKFVWREQKLIPGLDRPPQWQVEKFMGLLFQCGFSRVK